MPRGSGSIPGRRTCSSVISAGGVSTRCRWALATDGLNRLFSNHSAVLRLARDIGLGLVDRVPNLKRLFMREAAGLVGDVPKLLRGEAL